MLPAFFISIYRKIFLLQIFFANLAEFFKKNLHLFRFSTNLKSLALRKIFHFNGKTMCFKCETGFHKRFFLCYTHFRVVK